ncbi:MAG: SpoIID/LytB domain-containing protein [Nannocystaceae bacterium]
MSLSSRIERLYSPRFHFDETGEPWTTIGLVEHTRSVDLSAEGGLRVLPSGPGGTSIAAGNAWTISVEDGKPARQRFEIALESFEPSKIREASRARETWAAKGLTVHQREVGSLFGVGGRVLDTRAYILTAEAEASDDAEAARRARVLQQRHGAIGTVHAFLDSQPNGRLVARDRSGNAVIKAQQVLWFEPTRAATTTVHNVPYGVTSGTKGSEDRKYRGLIYVAVGRDGKLCVVNQVRETDILAGLVPAEIYASAPSQALAAQAIAARGQLVAKVGTRHLADPFLLCAHQHCQVYAGASKEHPRTTAAVKRTRGEILMRPGRTTMVDTVYSANSGGHTEHNELVWDSPLDAQLRGRPDPLLHARFAKGIAPDNLRAWLNSAPKSYSSPKGSSGRSSYRWTTTIDPASVAGNRGVPEEFGALKGLSIHRRGVSGRAIDVSLVGTRGEVRVRGEFAIRSALGGLKSSMFVVDDQRDSFGRFVLHGGGHGHGVGMCQHGAMGMARANVSTARILSHYYGGATVVRLWGD